MPQTRKRKRVEKISDETEKKGRKRISVPSMKPQIEKECPDASEDEFRPTVKTSIKVKKKGNASNLSSNKKNVKIKKENRQNPSHVKSKFSHPVKIKNETSDSGELHQPMDSSDSGILSETFESVKEEITSDVVKNNKISKNSSAKEDLFRNPESSSESEWEEVEEHCEVSLDDYKPNIPKEGVEITIDCPDLTVRKRKKKKFDENEWIRLHINRVRKDIQLSIHKTHLLCLLAHGIYVNKVLNSDTLKALALSFISNDILVNTSAKKIDKLDESGIKKIVSWFRSVFTFKTEKNIFENLIPSLETSFKNKQSMNASEFNLMFVIVARSLGLRVRFCISLYPVTYKASNLIKKPSRKKDIAKPTTSDGANEENSLSCIKKNKKATVKKEPKSKKVKRENECSENSNEPGTSRPRRSKGKSYKMSSDEDDDDKDYAVNSGSEDEKPQKKYRRYNNTPKSKPNRQILSSDSESGTPCKSSTLPTEPNSVVCWAEIFCKSNKQWVCVECVNNIVNKPYDIEVLVPQPVTYILAVNNESFVKDVTRKYCNEYMTSTIKLRADPDWWDETIESFLPPNSKQNREEEKQLDEILVNKPLPTTVQGFKNHPLYALKRHLLKFEAIYPPDAPTVGFLRSEPVYARDCVHQLHSRETWLKEARVVKIGEQPYKVVKARPKWDKIASVLRTDLPLEIFGKWQTEPYKPPIAVGGKVPRNEYGNVELFKPCMLPRGTVHLQLPGLNRIAKKLNIDCSPAVVGFDGHKGSVHPVFDGFIICEEFKDVIIAAWDEEQENIRKREEEKREKRVYGNWKKLIKGLLIRERIKLKYDTK